MAQTNTWRARQTRLMHRVHARRAAKSNTQTTFVTAPEPRTIGLVTRGQQLVAGNFLFAGQRVEGKGRSIWDVARDNENVSDEVQGCAWLDDLAAVGDERARDLAQKWVFDWINRNGDGRSDGWTPGVVGRRLIRWINHGLFLLRGQDEAASDRFFQSLAQQTLFVSRRWKVTTPGIRRFEALAGTIYASLALDGMEQHAGKAVFALAQDCQSQIDADGAIATRNPEELLEILSLLNWTVQSLAQTGRKVPSELIGAIDRIAPTLRGLRHADGGLARFHGGARGVEGRLDEALAASGVKALPQRGLHMGYARLIGGRTSVIADAAAPPEGAASSDAHASTLGFELTSGRRSMIVNCGSGARFGEEWRRASRATPSHSTLGIDGRSSSHLAPLGRLIDGGELLRDLPTNVRGNVIDGETQRTLELSHNGYQTSHGLTHARILRLSVDGRNLEGEDLLTTLEKSDEAIFNKMLMQTGIRYSIRFHLHPDVEATAIEETTAVSLTLKSGEVWVFRHDSKAKLSLSPSVYLQNGRLKPVATQQVVLSGSAMSYATRVRWSLAKAQDTPTAVRDLVQADPLDAVD